MALRSKRVLKNSKAMTHVANHAQRRAAAVWNEIPMLVSAATYPAKHSGHFGVAINIAIGASHPAIRLPELMNRLTGLCSGQFSQHIVHLRRPMFSR